MLKKASFIIVFFVTLFSYSQNADAEMEKIIQEKRDYNKSIETTDGFRIQIFQGISESSARSAQNRFTSLFPEIPSYISYSSPEWKVQVGNYKLELDAVKDLQRIRREFSTALKLRTKIKVQ